MVVKVLLLILISVLIILLTKNEYFTNNNKLDVAVIVEPREHKYLIPVVKNFIKNLPLNTKIHIFHGTTNLEFIKNGLGEYIKKGKIILTNLNKENLSIKDYNILLTNKKFWKSIDGENILIFQTDTCICSKNKNKIYKLLEYDYVGAPWKNRTFGITGGNGGLSFRKKSKMIKLCDKYKHGHEDRFYSSRKSLNYPKKKEAINYLVETIYSPNPYGVHKCWNYLKKEEMTTLRKNCPEINEIFNK